MRLGRAEKAYRTRAGIGGHRFGGTTDSAEGRRELWGLPVDVDVHRIARASRFDGPRLAMGSLEFEGAAHGGELARGQSRTRGVRASPHGSA